MGASLKLPPWLEPNRTRISQMLPEIKTSQVSHAVSWDQKAGKGADV
jgi:hypothetical protein